MDSAEVFDSVAEAYDRWYELPKGFAVFSEELECFRMLVGRCGKGWLEVGVGTGRFAEALDIGLGVDPAPNMLAKCIQRGINVQAARAEELPYGSGVFEGVLLAMTFSFLDDREEALRECGRVLRTGGKLLLGTVPADSEWGRHYIHEGRCGHPVYSKARFYRTSEIIGMAEKEGLVLQDSSSALFHGPGAGPECFMGAKKGLYPGAGFAAMLFCMSS